MKKVTKNNYLYIILVVICGLMASFLIYINSNISFTNQAYALSGDFCDDGTPVGQCSGIGNPGTKGQPYKCVTKNGINYLRVYCQECGSIGTNQCAVSQCYYQAYPHEPQNSGCYEKTGVIFADHLESQTEVENIVWNHLTYAGGSFAPGKFGYAYLPGDSGHLVFHLSENNMNGKPFYGLRGDQGTLELWVNPQTGFNQPDKKSVFLDENLNSANRFSLYYKNNNIYFERAGQGDEISISQSVNWSVNSWHQILATYGAQGTKLYIDGNLTSNPSVNGIGNFANNVYIGSDVSGANSADFFMDYLTFYGYQKTDLGICSEIPAIDYQCPAISTVNRIKIDFTTTASHTFMDILNNARLDNVKIDTNQTAAEVQWNFDHQLLDISNNSGTVSGSLTAIIDQINDSQPIIFNTGKTCDGNFSVTIYNYNTNSPIAKLNHANNKTSNCDVDHISMPATDLTASGPYQTVSQTSPVDHLVWAYYYTWYYEDQNNQSLPMQDIMPTQKALTGHYYSEDPDLIRAHIQAAKAHGIDGFAVAADFSTNNNLVNTILNVAQEENFKIAPSPYIGDDNGQTIPELVNGGLSFFQHYGNDNRLYSVDGKKVIFWWVTTPYTYQELRTQVFDVLDQAGYHGFNVSMIDGTMNSSPYIDYNSIGNYAQGANLSNADYYNCAQGLITKTYNLLYGSDQTVISMPTITPGGNENVISFIQPYRAGIYRDRCDGGTLDYLFDAAIQSKPDWLMITSWNEFPEHTHIEPDNYMSVNYLNMIIDYSAQLKAQSVPPPSMPLITLSVNSLPDFGNVAVGSNSTAKNYTVSGNNLTADITITAPTNFQVSQNNINFNSLIILTKSGLVVPTTTVYVRFSPGSTGIKSGNITHTSTGAVTHNVAVSGTGVTQSSPPPPPPPIPLDPDPIVPPVPPIPPNPPAPLPTSTTPIIDPGPIINLEPTADPLSPQYYPPADPLVQVGECVKLADVGTIYYLSESDHQRYSFPNPTVFNSWYYNFDDQYKNVQIIPLSELQSYPLVGNVTMRPGTKLIKIPSDPKVYAVTPGAVLHWIINESVFYALGYNFSMVADVPDVLFQDYTIGEPITTAAIHPAGTLIKYPNSSTVYYFNGSEKRSFASEYAFFQNKFYWMYVLTVPVSYNYQIGSMITAMETNLRLSW